MKPAFPTSFRGLIFLFLSFVFVQCDHGFSPPEPSFGTLQATISYTGNWTPACETTRNVYFVALPFIPTGGVEEILLNFTEIAISDPLLKCPSSNQDAFTIQQVPSGSYVYSAVIIQASESPFDIVPVGLYSDNGGIFTISRDEITSIHVDVDFNNLPVFPPQ